MRALWHIDPPGSRMSGNTVLKILGGMLFLWLPAVDIKAEEYVISSVNSMEEKARVLKAGDVLNIEKGVYRQSVTLTGLKGSQSAPVIIRGRGDVLVEASGQDGVFLDDCDYVVLERLAVRNGKRAGIVAGNSRHITIRDCRIFDNGKWGIHASMSEYITVERCEVYGSVLEHGIYFSTTDYPEVTDSRIHDNVRCGIHLNGDKHEGGDGMITGGLIRGNFIYQNGEAGGAAINMDGVERMVVQENTIFSNYAGGITSFCGDSQRAGSGNKFLNNVVCFESGKGRYALQLFGKVSDVLVENNVFVCGRGPVLELGEETVDGLICDDNVYFDYGRNKIVSVGGKLMNLQDWQKSAGRDRKSVVRKMMLNNLIDNKSRDVKN